MKNFDSFFSSSPDPELNDRILKHAKNELEINRTAKNRKRWITFLAPLMASLAAVFVFRFVGKSESDLFAANSEHIEFIADLIDDEDTMEIIDNLALLEELELMEELDIEGAEYG